MLKKIFCLLLSLCLLISIAPMALAAEVSTQSQIYNAMIAMEAQYPEDAVWTNDNFYEWNGYSPAGNCFYSGGYGCVGFAFMLSDAAFGDLPGRKLTEITIADVRPGDVLRINENSHSVIVLEVHEDYVIIAEGNYLGKVHWGRKLTAEQVAAADYLLTRYPEDYPAGITLTGWRKAYYDLVSEDLLDSDEVEVSEFRYSLLDINGDEYPELWIDYFFYASGCRLATITDQGLYSELLQSGSLRYLEGENKFLYSCGKDGYFSDSIYTIENGKFLRLMGGFEYAHEERYVWNGEEVSLETYISSIDKQVDPSDALYAHDESCTYEEFVSLLEHLEAQYGPDEAIPEKPPVPTFSDVIPGAFYEEAVTWAVEKGITNGRTETTFAPGDECLRTEVVTFLWRSQNSPEPVVPLEHIPLTDIQDGRFYTDAVRWAVGEGITQGISETLFGTANTCTRAQVVTFLWRTAGSPEPTSTDCPFTDVKEGAFYYNAVLWAVEKGITNGMTADTFGVSETCTRGQIVTFLHRFSK